LLSTLPSVHTGVYLSNSVTVLAATATICSSLAAGDNKIEPN
jgi:hypothetical protein